MEIAPLPERYDRDRLVLLVKDPYWLHAYWEVTPVMQNKITADMLLRVYGFTPETYFFDIEINSSRGSYYINVDRPNTQFYAEIGFWQEGVFRSLIRSNTVRTPRDKVSEAVDENWLSLKEIYRKTAFQKLGPASPEFIENISFDRHLDVASEAMVLKEDR